MVKGVNDCNLCKQSKKSVKLHKAKYGKNKVYQCCPECHKSMMITQAILDSSHNKALLSGKYKKDSASLVLIPCG